jgi:hypothetical protein
VTARLGLPAAVLLFAVLSTANSGGYRYGASDHAFYAAAIAERADPSLFPRDKPLLAAQSRLWLGDDLIGGLARLVSPDLPRLFIVIYGLTLVALFAAGAWFMRAIGGSSRAAAGLLLLLTFRHRIAKTGANTLEGYMHPRMLAFAIGLAALAALVRGRALLAVVLIAATAVLHTTTALWFGIVVGVALVWAGIRRPEGRRLRMNGVARPWLWIAVPAAAALVAWWAFTSGPLAGRLTVIDPEWLAVIEGKDYLFPIGWPIYAWIANLAYPLVLVLIFRRRLQLGVAREGERALIAGLLALVAIFLVSVPLTALRLALAVQMQVNRVFWVLDVVVAAYAAWWFFDLRAAAWGRMGRAAALGALLALSAGRGFYILAVEAQRPLVEIRPRGEWIEAMSWLARQPERWHVLADPQHAWKYGVSVRVAGLRDVVLETSKDSALAMYDRGVAMRVAERLAALSDFDRLDTGGARALADRYATDVVVVERPATLGLPVLHENSRFVIYDLR